MACSCGCGAPYGCAFFIAEIKAENDYTVSSYHFSASASIYSKPVWEERLNVRESGDISIISKNRLGDSTIVTHEVVNAFLETIHGPHKK